MLKVYTLEQADKWDEIVHSFPQYEVFYLSGYVKAFELHGDGKPLLFFYTESIQKDSLCGINVVMLRDIGKSDSLSGLIHQDTLYDFSTPYGYGGWLIKHEENGTKEKLFEEYEEWCKEHNIISEFVRFIPNVKNHLACEDYYNIAELGETVTMDLSSPELIWKNISSKNRNVIRKAKKNGVKIYNGRFPEIFDTFLGIYNKTMERDQADEYYFFDSDFYDSILNDLDHNAQVFYAELDDHKIIAAAIMINANKKMYYHLSGSLNEYSSLAATNLLLYSAALWGYENGYHSLYLGGGVGSKDDGLFKFKKSFYRGELHSFFIGKKIFLKNEYNNLLELRKLKNCNSSFFPLYRIHSANSGGNDEEKNLDN